jgi:hypothetical protein
MPIIASRASAAYGAGFGKGASGGGFAGPFGSYDSLATASLTSTTNTVTFTGIPSNYRHLQLRIANLSSGQDNYIMLRFNGVADTYYGVHQIDANGSGTPTFSQAGNPVTFVGGAYTGDATYPTVAICDIFDYSVYNTMKSVRTLHGTSRNASLSYMGPMSSGWQEPNPIQQIEIIHGNIAGGKVFNANSHFALYGVK